MIKAITIALKLSSRQEKSCFFSNINVHSAFFSFLKEKKHIVTGNAYLFKL